MPKKRSNVLRLKSIIPSSVTYTNMFLGVGAIFLSILGGINNFKIASVLILVAGVTDKLDGFIARKLGVTSEFGKELDSLCDLVSFGISPIILWWVINRDRLGVGQVLVPALFVAAGVFRLARYNITREDGYIRGLPITLAGMIVALKCILDITYRASHGSNILNYENSIIMLVLSIMMVSKLKVKKPL